MCATRWETQSATPLVFALLFGCAASSPPIAGQPRPDAPRAAAGVPAPSATAAPEPDALAAQALERHVRALCSDAMAGRAAGSDGEQRAFDYASSELERLGLKVQSQAVALRGGGMSQNRFAFIDPAGGRTEPLIVLGAHIDHLGVRDGKVHHGAEDNASGVAVVLGVAASLVARRDELHHAVLILVFGAEELGMVGSRAFVREHPELVQRSQLMVNLDMIGRPLADQALLAVPKRVVGIDSDASVGVLGTRDRPELRALVHQVFEAEQLDVVGLEDLPAVLAAIVARIANGRSDSFTFEDVGVPALFFSSGESDDYHRPSDTPDRLDYRLMARRAAAIAELVVRLSARPATQETP